MKNNINLVIIGLIIVAVAIHVISRVTPFEKTALKTTATIISHDSYPLVEFSVDGKIYKGRLSSDPLFKFKGSTVKIIYDPTNPQKFHYVHFNLKMWLLLLGGTLFIVAGVWCIAIKKDIMEFRKMLLRK